MINKEEFVQRRVSERDLLLKKIVEEFKILKPAAIHLFGSGATGFADEFSDLDVWITFKDADISQALTQLNKTFPKIAPTLVKHQSKAWSPVGGSSHSIIHKIGHDLFVVDYYISRLSETTILSESKALYGDDSIKRGEWKLNRHVNKKIKDTHTFRKDVDLLLDLIFISVKGIVRKWENDDFRKTLEAVYKSFLERYPGTLKHRPVELSFQLIYELLEDLLSISNKRQKRAISQIRKYTKLIEDLYFM